MLCRFYRLDCFNLSGNVRALICEKFKIMDHIFAYKMDATAVRQRQSQKDGASTGKKRQVDV